MLRFVEQSLILHEFQNEEEFPRDQTVWRGSEFKHLQQKRPYIEKQSSVEVGFFLFYARNFLSFASAQKSGMTVTVFLAEPHSSRVPERRRIPERSGSLAWERK